MSTRVDKGGPKFRPIIKSKARPSTTPALQDERARPSVEPNVSMPPPSSIPERAPSMVPSAVSLTAGPSDDSTVSGQPIRSSKPQGTGAAIVMPSARFNAIRPSRATPALVTRPEEAAHDQHPARPVVPIASTSHISTPSRGVPIAISRSTPAPSSTLATTSAPVSDTASEAAPPSTPAPSSSKGKKRATIQETDEGATADEGAELTQSDAALSSVARKRPKLSIVQAEDDRVKRPTRRAKGKKKAAVSGPESEATVEDGEGTGVEVPKTKKRAPRKKTNVDENAGDDNTTEPSRPKRTRAKRKQTQETDEDAEAVAGTEWQSESESPIKKKRKKRQRVATEEPEGTPEPIDPMQVTMSAICDDPGSGRVSSRWETSQVQYAEARKRAREERERAIAEAAEEERETGRAGTRKGVPRPTLPGDEEGAAAQESVAENTGGDPDEFTYSESMKASHYAPQVRIGANGEVVLDVESLQVDRAADPEITEEAYSFVEESDQSKFTNSNSWSKRRSVRWGKEDTAMFYDALRQFGQNFDLIARVLPGRTYRMCKNKFKAEDKKNPGLIDDALKNGVAVDLAALSRMTGKDFSGPTPIIEARKALDLAESDAPAARVTIDEPERSSSVLKESQTPGLEGDEVRDTGNNTSEAEAITRHSASPPPTASLLSTLGTARQSASPPPAESLLSAVRSPLPIASPSGARSPGPVVILASKRTSAPVPISVLARQPPARQAAAESTQTQIIAEPPVPSAKKRGKKNAQEVGVEVLGLAEDHLDE